MANMMDHDRRQLTRMVERLELFKTGDLSLRVLISDLEFLLNAFEAVDSSVREQLRVRWEVLEDVYSIAVGMHGGKLDPPAEASIIDAVAAMHTRIDELLQTKSEE